MTQNKVAGLAGLAGFLAGLSGQIGRGIWPDLERYIYQRYIPSSPTKLPRSSERVQRATEWTDESAQIEI